MDEPGGGRIGPLELLTRGRAMLATHDPRVHPAGTCAACGQTSMLVPRYVQPRLPRGWTPMAACAACGFTLEWEGPGRGWGSRRWAHLPEPKPIEQERRHANQS